MFFVVGIGGVFNKSHRTTAQTDKTIEAWTAAQVFMNEKLKSPSTANYGWQDPRKCVESLGERNYRVQGWVDSQNSFGATIRSKFSLIVKDEGDGNNWSLVGDPEIR